MPLLERGEAMAALHEYAAAAVAGRGSVVLVSGEAGVGKSSLLEHLEAGTPDLRWLHGSCDGVFTPRPLAPLFDIAGELGGDLLAACAGEAPRDHLFRQLLAVLIDAGPCAVAMEDIHWADESTLDLVAFLGRRVRDLPILFVCTYRDDAIDSGHPLRLVVGDLASSRSTRRVSLGPLSEAAVHAMAEGSGVPPEELFRLSGGNPFFVSEVLASGAVGVPESARDAVLARLVRLSPSGRRLADVAALLGARLDPTTLAALVPDASIDDLIRCGLVVSDADGLRFRHELGRRAVEGAVPVHRRREIHAAALELLAPDERSDNAYLAYLAEGAQDPGAVARFALRAASDAAALGAHREAAQQYERALRFADRADAGGVAELYDLLAREAALTDAWDRAATAGERAWQAWQELGDVRREGRALSNLSRAMWRLCRPESALYAALSVELLEPLGATEELAWAYAGVAKSAAEMRSDADAGIAMARDAQRMADELGRPDIVSDALNSEACVRAAAGQEWEPTLRRALAVALGSGAEDAAGRAYANLWLLLAEENRLPECEQVLDEGTRYCDEHDLGTYACCLRAGRARWLLARGRWDEAVTTARPLLFSDVSSPANKTMLATTIGTVLARRGDPMGRDVLASAHDNAVRSEERGWLLEVLPAWAELLWLAGDDDASRAAISTAVAALDGRTARPAGSLAVWCRRLGLPAPEHAAGAAHDPAGMSLAGDWRGAAARWDEMGMPYDAALACLDSETADGMNEAARRFDALGAAAAVVATRRRMRVLGLRPSSHGPNAMTRAHPLGLTRREADVLDGLTAGRTNAEIAASLVLSPRTVDHHVSSLLAKLGVASRAQAVAVAGRAVGARDAAEPR
ncbi:MAG TPA: AAA family ATPase [Candidatus Nanopelagicales bacterium]|nr:AAA family ATPase [Candidatus Nanopelagicales bacterium]